MSIDAKARPVRMALVEEFGSCMICGCSPERPKRSRELSQLCCHEIANGPLRRLAYDKPYCILVLCWYCNGHEVEDKSEWPRARQLALLMTKSPQHYDLVAFNYLVNPRAPRAIEQFEVDEFLDSVKAA